MKAFTLPQSWERVLSLPLSFRILPWAPPSSSTGSESNKNVNWKASLCVYMHLIFFMLRIDSLFFLPRTSPTLLYRIYSVPAAHSWIPSGIWLTGTWLIRTLHAHDWSSHYDAILCLLLQLKGKNTLCKPASRWLPRGTCLFGKDLMSYRNEGDS